MWNTYRTCNSTVRFSKYEFYNKLLGSITLLRFTPSLYIYIYIIFTPNMECGKFKIEQSKTK